MRNILGTSSAFVVAITTFSLMTCGLAANAIIEQIQHEITEGENFEYICDAGSAISSCNITIPGGDTQNLDPEDRHWSNGRINNKGSDFKTGKCGFSVPIVDSRNGTFVCKLAKIASAQQYVAKINLVVQHVRMEPTLTLAADSDTSTLKVTCMVTSFSYHLVQLTWTLGEGRITSGLQPLGMWGTTPGIHNTRQELRLPIRSGDEGKKLRCVVKHPEATWTTQFDGTAEITI